MEAYKRVAAARAKGRPTGSDFIEHIFEGFVELHGDRRFADDKAIVAGVAMLNDMPVTVIAIDRGKDTKEKIKRNFGSAHPEGYRKALRQMKLAEKFNRPVICFIDTSGAYCGIGAEERGQAQAIAENLMEMMTLLAGYSFSVPGIRSTEPSSFSSASAKITPSSTISTGILQ